MKDKGTPFLEGVAVLCLREQLIWETTAPVSQVKITRNNLASSKYIVVIWEGEFHL